MMINAHNHKLLREYVESILREDDYGGAFDAAASMSPYGMHYASGDQLFKTFVKPFSDVIDTAKGKTKETIAGARTVLRVAFEAAMTTIIPILVSDYEEIFAEEQESLDKIRNEYSEVYKANWDALKTNDAAMLAFMCNPSAALTGKLAREAPKTTISLLSILSGGSLDSFLDKVKARYPSLKEGLIREDEKQDKQKKMPPLSDVLANEKVISRAVDNPQTQRMQSEARAIVRETLQKLYDNAHDIMSSTTLADLQNKVGKPLEGTEEIRKAKPEERKQLETQLLDNIKKSMKEYYVKNLEAQVKSVVETGIPENSNYVKDYMSVIQKISSF